MADTTPDDISSLAGALLISCVVNWGLLGVLCVQVYVYYLAFPKDRKAAKLLIYGVFLCEVLQTIIITRDTYVAFASGFGNVKSLDSMHTHWFTIPISGGIVGCIGQLYFAYRMSVVAESKFLPIAVVVLSIASTSAAMVSAAQFFMAGSFTFLRNNTLTAVGIWNGLGAFCDLTIAIAMPYLLLRRGTGLSNTHVLITKIIRLTVETGALTAFVAIAHLILYFAPSITFIIAGANIAKIYANTILVLLNNRLEITNGRDAIARREYESAAEFSVSSTSRILVSRDRLTILLDDLPRAHIVKSRTSASVTFARNNEEDSTQPKISIEVV
ncbi:hypothetical protein BDQ12DRAFT_392800 [Crucibulum laeve]|uniref:DUF6534 domain-containing protein n=1 Tax=Crucibulum laeve TaxID=68775 RepID=A0A5C3M9X5_9AGAR|nr:hypothetical protein BDQ12DRAFT_392800 [Crucibulum laeve]